MSCGDKKSVFDLVSEFETAVTRSCIALEDLNRVAEDRERCEKERTCSLPVLMAVERARKKFNVAVDAVNIARQALYATFRDAGLV